MSQSGTFREWPMPFLSCLHYKTTPCPKMARSENDPCLLSIVFVVVSVCPVPVPALLLFANEWDSKQVKGYTKAVRTQTHRRRHRGKTQAHMYNRHTYTGMPARMRAHTHMRMHVHTHTHTLTDTRRLIYTLTLTHTHTHTHIIIYTHTLTHTRSHTHTLSLSLLENTRKMKDMNYNRG